AGLVIPLLDTLARAEARVAAAQRDLQQAQKEREAAQSEVQRRSAAREHAQQGLSAIPPLRNRIQALDELRGIIERRGKVAEEVRSTDSAIATATKAHKAEVTQLRKAGG